MTISPKLLFVTGAWAAVLGGAMRMAAAFIAFTPETAWLEILYATIDVCLLLATLAIYGRHMPALGLTGLIAATLACLGLASIIGPDPIMFGIDFYQLGAGVVVVSLAALSVQLLRAGVLRWAATFWLFAFLLALVFSMLEAHAILVGSGVAFGLGFIVAGLNMITGPRNSAA